jgi:hypothetical protein
MRANVLLAASVSLGLASLSSADPPRPNLTQGEAIRLALVEAQRLNLDLSDVEARSAAFHATEAGVTWYVYFQRKSGHECSFVMSIDDNTGKAQPGTRPCG